MEYWIHCNHKDLDYKNDIVTNCSEFIFKRRSELLITNIKLIKQEHEQYEEITWFELYHRIISFVNEKYSIDKYSATGYLFEVMLHYPILPSINGINRAAGNGHLNIIRWCQKHNLLPNYVGVGWAVYKGHYHIVRYCE